MKIPTAKERLKRLEEFIIPLPFEVLRRYGEEKIQQETISKIPIVWYNDLRKICKLYRCKLVFVPYKKSPYKRSYYSSVKRTIFFAVNDFVGSYDLIEIFCHELAHRIQRLFYGMEEEPIMQEELYSHLCYIYEGKNKHTLNKFEREADELGWLIYKKYFSSKIKISRREWFRNW